MRAVAFNSSEHGPPREEADRYSALLVQASTYARKTSFILVWYPGPRSRNQASTSSSIRNVICCLRTTGLKPSRTMASAKSSGESSGTSDISISSSCIASTSFQSVWFLAESNVSEVDFLFTLCRLSDRDDSDFTVSFCMSNDHRSPRRHSDTDVTGLRVQEPLIFNCHCDTIENVLGDQEVYPMLAAIGLSLLLVPSDLHIVVTLVGMSMRPRELAAEIEGRPEIAKGKDAASMGLGFLELSRLI